MFGVAVFKASRLDWLGGTSAGRSRVDLPNLAVRCQYWGYICQQI